MKNDGIEGIMATIFLIIFIIVIGYAFFPVFEALPNASWLGYLFIIFIAMLLIAIVYKILSGSGE